SECDEEELDEKTIKEMVDNCYKLFEKINSAKKEITKVKQQLDADDRAVKELLAKMKKAKEEYDALMIEHKKEVDAGQEKLSVFKKKLDEAEAKLPKEMIDEYKRIKGFRQNPVAKLENNRCSGCRMQLPASVERKVMEEDRLILCENCGRILVVL
ncbi:MAG: zinc ribbon domain-containing protein, partial [Lachnospiraceae bacterium]